MSVPASWTAKAPEKKAWRQEFDAPLGPEWVYIQNPEMSRYKMNKGQLNLTGAGPLEENDHPTFVGVRQESPGIVAETKVRLETSSGEAGIVAYQNPDGFVSLSVKNGRAVLRLKLKSVSTVLGTASLRKGKEAVLRIISEDGNRYRFEADGKVLGELETSLLSSEVCGGFTGVVLGLYAVEGTANFEYFDYQEK